MRRCRRRWTTRAGTARTAPPCSRPGRATAPPRCARTAPTPPTATSSGTARPTAPPATSAARPTSPTQTRALELANTLQHQAKQGQAATQLARARRRQALRVTRLRRPAREGASRHLSARLAPRLAPSARAPPPPPCLLVAIPSSSPSSPSSCVSWCANLLDQKESEAASPSQDRAFLEFWCHAVGEDLTIVRSSSLMFLAVFVTSAHENGSSLITLPELSCFKEYTMV